MNEDKMAYAAVRPCGHLCGAACDDGTDLAETANWVADCIKGGLTVERMTVARIRAAQWCDGDGSCAQGKLPLEAEADRA